MSVQPHGIYVVTGGKICQMVQQQSPEAQYQLRNLWWTTNVECCSKDAPNSEALYATNTSTTQERRVHRGSSLPSAPNLWWWMSARQIFLQHYDGTVNLTCDLLDIKCHGIIFIYPVRHLLEIFVIMTQKLSNRSQWPWHLSCDSTHYVILVLGSICSFLPKFTQNSQCTNIIII